MHDDDLTDAERELDDHLDAAAAADPRLADWDAEVDHTMRIRAEAERVRRANALDGLEPPAPSPD
jgi:NADPH-dependent 2,4-dienoyl-CoA reductase/sulfur reductase-like enzyme